MLVAILYLNCYNLSFFDLGENEFEEGKITPYSSPPELPDVMKAPEVSASANE